MRWIGRATRVIPLALLTFGSPEARSDERPRPVSKAEEAVDRVLAEWQEKAKAITSVEVRFRQTTRAKGSAVTRGQGRAILAAPNLAFLELGVVDADDKLTEIKERTIWNGRSILRFDMVDRKAYRYPIRTEWAFPPEPIRLPFFFGMNVEQAKRDYDWSLILENREQVVLDATAKVRPGVVTDYKRFRVLLDRKTFLPVKFTMSDRNGDVLEIFDAIDIKINQFDDLEGLKSPCLDAWTLQEVDGWLARLLLK